MITKTRTQTASSSNPPSSFGEIKATLRRADLSALPPLSITILRNVVVEPIETYLRYFAFEIGYRGRVRFGEYDQVAQEAIGGSADLLNASTGCVVVFTSLDVLSWDLARNFAALSASAIDQEVARIGEFIEATIQGIRRQTAATVLWHGFELPLSPALGIADTLQSHSQVGVVSALNERLRRALAGTRSAYFVDLNTCRARLGRDSFYDRRYWHIGRAPYSRVALEEIAREDFKYIRALKGKQKKCLVLDCDDVLWGGVVAEEGLSGIKLGPAYPGSPYYELQQEILNLHHRGVILALCSKNNEEDVWDVFRHHPDMLLREQHISAARINWNDKATGLREIAADLNVGLDSLLFVDDSEVECDLVRRLIPEVEVLHLPRDQAVHHRARLAAGGWFDTLTVSDDDRKRGSHYAGESARAKLRAGSPDLETYFQSLEMSVQIRRADTLTVPRIAQLTQKTNQFNASTRRYSEEEIARFAAHSRYDVVGLRLADRFGDAGLVGAAILAYEDGRAAIDTFLLSCRVLGRGIEDVFLAQCLKRIASRGATIAVGEFRPTARNQRVRDFYAAWGFRSVDVRDGIEQLALNLKDYTTAAPSFFKSIDARFEASARIEG